MLLRKINAASVVALVTLGSGVGVLHFKALGEEKVLLADSPEADPLSGCKTAALLPSASFGKVFGSIKPQPKEFAWYEEIPWLLTIHEARERAAAEDKPILFWMAANGHLCGPI